MRYVYPVLMNGRILTVSGNDRRALAAMRKSAAGFGDYDSRNEAVFKMPIDESKRGTGEQTATVSIRGKDGRLHEFHAERWQVSQDFYENGHRRASKL